MASLDRRRFLRLGAAATVGLGGADARAARAGAAGEGPAIRNYVTLGRTGLVVSDVSFGSSRSADPDLVRHALARGVTYFDTAESYRFGTAEEAIGEGLAGVRDKVVLATKTKAGAHDGRDDMMRALEDSLKRLKTDYVDVYFNHAVNDVARLENEEWREFTERAKQQGKIRFRGVSGHGSRLADCLRYAVDHDLADVILCAYSFAQDPDFVDRLRHTLSYVALQPELPEVLEAAKAKGVGVIAMKTLMGGRLNDLRAFETDGATFAQAAFRWVLSSPRVDALVVSMTSRALIDEYVGGSGVARAGGADLRLLARYAARNGARTCQHGCDACAGACPHGVEIAEVLRTRMYDVDYGDRVLARADYARLGDGAAACLGCAHRACRDACPNGIPIAAWTRDAARRLA
jgi:predicted aldo/keto reductase-like oxidoreductase